MAARSKNVRRLIAETIPTGIPASRVTTIAPPASEIVAGRRSAIRPVTEAEIPVGLVWDLGRRHRPDRRPPAGDQAGDGGRAVVAVAEVEVEDDVLDVVPELRVDRLVEAELSR